MRYRLALVLASVAVGGVFLESDRVSAATFDLSQFQLNGAAFAEEDALHLIPAETNRIGSAFAMTPIVLAPNTSFQSYFSFVITDSDVIGGDGLAFLLQADPRGPTALGMQGGNLGYGGTETRRISPSLAVEFDTFQNSLFGITADPDDNHVGINLNGSLLSQITASPAVDLNGGEPLHVWFDYDGTTDQLAVFLNTVNTKPTESLLSTSFDLFEQLGPEVYWGFSAATQGGAGRHTILQADLTPSEQQIPEPASALSLLIVGGLWASVSTLRHKFI